MAEIREAVIVEAVRSPIGKRNGSLKDTHPVDLLAEVLKEAVSRSGVDPGQIEDHITGCVSQVGDQSINVGRNGWLAAGFPEEVPSTTVDRQCGSSQQSIHFAAQGVMAGAYDLVMASGVENMTRVPMGSSMAGGMPFSPAMLARYEGKIVPQSRDPKDGRMRFRIVAPMRFPAGLAGSQQVVFLLPRDVPMPAGNPGHSPVIPLDEWAPWSSLPG